MFLHSCLLMEIDIFDDSSSTKAETQKNGLTEKGCGNLSQWSLPHIGWLIVRRRCATKPNHTTVTDEIDHLL